MLEAEREVVVERERAFHDERFADDHRRATAKYYAVEAGRADYAARLEAVPAGTTAVEYGCGVGSAAFDLAGRGVEVLGVDISTVAVETAREEAAGRGVPARFEVMDAHDLRLPAGWADLVCGSGILHHLDLEAAYPEIARVLAPAGTAIFYEPLGTNPLINLYRRLTPSMRTPDEHPLVPSDFDLARRWFGVVEHEPHTILALAAAPLARLPRGRTAVGALQRLDRWLLRRLPWTRRFAWVVVLRLAEPRTA